MKSPEIPINEEDRLRSLHDYNILDSIADQDYDDITKIASQITQSPISLISLVDKDRQWFKSKVGIDVNETPRDISFCAHAINQKELLEVPNPLEDERFYDNPLVEGELNVRFYAGAPLINSSGYVLGTICVIDQKSKTLSSDQKEGLMALSRMVINTMEQKRKNQLLIDTSEQLKNELDKSKAQEFELRVSNEEAYRGIQAKDTFMSNMSHEIRTPMNGIIGVSDIILDDKELPIKYRELVEHINSSAKSLLTIINDILDLSKINAEKLSFETKNFQFKDAFRSVRHSLAVLAKDKGINFDLDIASEIPETVAGDPVRISQILFNIAGNAIKFTDQGSVSIRAKLIASNVKGPKIEISVSDTGIGIPQDKLDMIFDAFNQSDINTYNKYGGTGLGLTISKNLIQMHEGDINVQSQVGKGTTFTFTLQLSHAQEEVVVQEKESNFVDITPEERENIKILIAEDNKVNQIVAKRVLSKYGFKVDIAENGVEAIEKVRANTYDLVLMDVNMPVMNGLEATRYIRKNLAEKSDIKVAAMTASVLKKDIDLCYLSGMNDFISKPFVPQELYMKIINMVRHTN